MSSLRGHGRELAELGFDAVFTEPSLEALKEAREAGLKAYACIWAFKAPRCDERLGVRSVFGSRSLWLASGCPNNPDVRRYSFKRVLEAVEHGFDGVVLDGVRFPAPSSGVEALFSCVCEHCFEVGRRLGVNMDEVAGVLRSFRGLEGLRRLLRGEGLQGWLELRAYSITRYVEEVRELLGGVELGAAVFTPCLAWMVGQDYAQLGGLLDFIQPMVYHRGGGAACLNYELFCLVKGFVEEGYWEEGLRTIYEELGVEGPLKLDRLLNGLPLSILEVEVARAKRMLKGVKVELTPIVFAAGLSREEVSQASTACFKCGVDGLVHFGY